MAVKKAKPANATRNNGGTVVNGGSVQAGPVTANLSVRDLASNGDDYGSKVIEKTGSASASADPEGIKKARTSGTFSYNAEKAGVRNFIVRAAGTASAGKINGTATNVLNTTGAEYAGVARFKSNSKTKETRIGVDQYSFPAVSIPNGTKYPGITRDANRGVEYSFLSTTDNIVNGSDKVLSANRAIPGELTYRTGSAMPKTTNLQPRDNLGA